MNKKLIIALVGVIILVAGGAVAYQFMNKDADESSTSNNSQEQSSSSLADDAASVADSSISQLLGAGISRKCTFNDQTSSGTIYFTGNNRMRADFTSSDPEEGDGSMIITEDRQYLWDTDSKEGIMMAIDPESFDEDDDMMTSDDEDEAIDLNQEYDFSCSIWIVNDALLTPPADVNFTDMAAFMPGSAQ